MSFKRIRGAALEKALQTENPFHSSSSSESIQSSLATKLLSLWAHGTLSAVMIRELAHLAILDGASHSELVALAKAGHWGKWEGNVSRDLMQTFAKGLAFKHVEVEVPCVDPKTSLVETTPASMFLPHLMFADLAKGHPQRFESMFGVSKLVDFWDGALKTNDDRLVGHPMRSKPDWKEKTIPIFVHGDGVEFQDRDSLMVWSWGAIDSLFNSLDNHILIAAFPKSSTSPDTWKPLMSELSWSLRALLDGKHPEKDNVGNALEKDSEHFLAKGLPLTPFGHRCVVWSLQGDHEFFSNVVGLPHWRNRFPCWECDGSNDAEPANKCIRTIHPANNDFDLVSNTCAAANPRSNHPIFDVPGVTTKMVRGDGLHILFTKGVYAHFLGSILAFMCWKEGPGAHQVVPPWKRLGLLFDQIQIYYNEHSVKSRLTNLKLSMFTSTKTPHAQHASLNSKGAENKHLAPALLKVCLDVLDQSHPVHLHIIKALEGIVGVVDIFDKAGIYLESSEYYMALAKAETFFEHYDWLHEWAVAEDRNLFHVVMKHHTFLHLVQNSRYLNPRHHCCFKSEDFVGKISKVTASVAMGVKSSKLSLKLAPKYSLLFHLRLTRDGFECPIDSINP